uniref:Uncharacterized protein n=1 Tax=Anguilla anguilla TaxID=7936 RepID=A0A0E9VSL8_ANGAN
MVFLVHSAEGKFERREGLN